ncbi:MAG: hypothetical protein R3C11_02520 [Planctomycetaceae bacterium]
MQSPPAEEKTSASEQGSTPKADNEAEVASADEKQPTAAPELVEVPYNPYFQVDLAEDDTFTFELLPPGHYRLNGTAYRSDAQNQWGAQIGFLKLEFDVPEAAEGEPSYNPEPLDLGEIEMVAPQKSN